MNKHTVNIKNIPKKIKKRITKYLYEKIILVGYKQVTRNYKTPIIELPNKTRIWVLEYEIENPNTI